MISETGLLFSIVEVVVLATAYFLSGGNTLEIFEVLFMPSIGCYSCLDGGSTN
jgi:hypothetical protein